MIFQCEIDFINGADRTKRTSAHFLMRARGWDEIQDKLERCSEASVFHGWEPIGWGAKRGEWESKVRGLYACMCTYGKKRGFQGTFKMSPVCVQPN